MQGRTSVIYTADGVLHDIYEVSLPQAIEEFSLRTIALTETAESANQLAIRQADKIIKLEDRIDALEQAMDKVFAHLNDDSIDKLILDRLKK
jgi:hypothetical protein